MKVYNPATHMNQNLVAKLEEYRNDRGFNAEAIIARKVELINQYFTQNKLSGAVLGVSGGVDSAVALGLVVKASQVPGSNIKRIVPLMLPAFDFAGATHQDEATARAENLCRQLNVTPATFHKLTQLSQTITEELETILGTPSTEWAQGQLVAYARTPILYNTCSILTDSGNPALVIGTTNLSEGGYLGYVGKASDGMVDLQIISDLYKSEVYQLARALNLPDSILDAIPTGDMYDGRDDETVFGTSYDFVELYHLWLQNGTDTELLKDGDFIKGMHNIENLHRYNSHKYTYSTPSIHLDIMNAVIPNGWQNTPWKGNR